MVASYIVGRTNTDAATPIATARHAGTASMADGNDPGDVNEDLASRPDTYPPGTVFGERYRVEDILGIGGFGAVYKCTQLQMDQIVAVKVLKGEHLTSEEHVKRFQREARAASKLRHPNTISMFDFGSHDDGALYMAMEYLEGETLADRIDSGKTLDAHELVHIMTQVCHSLTEAHEANLVHRDLKPENIMLMSVAGDPNFVKVLDFGIAKIEDEHSAHEERLTEMGMIMGTPTYMSPEQAYGKVLDARSDIYALGVLMYEGLTGRVPFEGDKPMEVLVKHIHNPPTPLKSIAPALEIPTALEKTVLRCLEKQPDDRPQSTRELAEDLTKALQKPDSALRKGRAEDPAGPDNDAAPTTHIPELAEQTTSMPVGTKPRRLDARPAASQPSTRALWVGIGAFSLVAIVALATALLAGPAPTQNSDSSPLENKKQLAAPTAPQTGSVTGADTGAPSPVRSSAQSEQAPATEANATPRRALPPPVGEADAAASNLVAPPSPTAQNAPNAGAANAAVATQPGKAPGQRPSTDHVSGADATAEPQEQPVGAPSRAKPLQPSSEDSDATRRQPDTRPPRRKRSAKPTPKKPRPAQPIARPKQPAKPKSSDFELED